ncbi:MAG TPA: branched-chain amino acid ABC transporter permease, partial [Afifellaceae bacterium]|nr:branched-chain amino acid ABC transporter permease [Afifellaceae bacterium]
MADFTDVLNAFVLLSNFVLLPALAYGSQLALGALGVTLVFGILRFANFAHGDMMAFGAMITVLLTWWFQSMGISFGPLPTALLALPFAVLATALLAVFIDRSVFAYYRHKKSPPVILLIASIGVMFMLNAIVRLVIGPDDQRFADGERFIITAGRFRELTGLDEGLAVHSTKVVTIVLAVAVMVALFTFLQRSRTGKA